MVPLRSGKCQFGTGDLVRREDALEVVPFAKIGAALVLDLAGADD
jgi:hypothetical protein